MSDSEGSDDEVLGIYSCGNPLPKILKPLKNVPTPQAHTPKFQSPVVFTSPSLANASEKYGSRANAGDVLFRYKCEDGTAWNGRKPSSEEHLTIEPVGPTAEFLGHEYRFMYQKMVDIKEVIEIMQEGPEEALSFASVGGNNKPESISILIAAGPFTPNDSLMFEPLKDLSSIIVKDEPDVCILIGPFIQSTHPLLQEPLNQTFGKLFINKLSEFEKEIKGTSTKIVIIPNYDDINSELVFPTPPYTSNSFMEGNKDVKISGNSKDKNKYLYFHDPKVISKRFMFFPDPAMISIGGIVVGVTSTDSLLHCKSDAIPDYNNSDSPLISGDKMTRATRHMLIQQSFYPMFPPDEKCPFDAGNFLEFGRMDVRPHILIVPSMLQRFIKNIDDTIVINPQYVAKSGGCYARILIDLSNEKDTITSIADFCIGEIIRI